ncbi:hypothetical protein Ocin01_14541 [Orchesella cincta]|uniref:Uncharacterized protein n=1 Tax=Orchesella cincta TaxID=48709 RepID=A0A1D2MGW9_ORCCI|nr:hypothetical protein Ocin01_14541 [Orchesella cincta]
MTTKMPPPSQPAQRPVPVKKSLRLWVKNNGHVIRKKKRFSYVYPRTVEAAKDPFECATGKNKMFFLIAIDLFPESKIIRPDNSDSETEVEETNQNASESQPPPSKVDSQPLPEKPERKRKILRKRTKKVDKPEPDPLPIVANSLKPHNPEITLGLCNTVEKVKPQKPVESQGVKGNSPRIRKRSTPTKSKKTGIIITETNNENETECSRLLQLQENTSLSKSNENSNKIDELVKDNSWLTTRKKTTAVPNIVNSFNKIVQTCSETGVVSFSLSKKPRQSRS